MVRKAAGTALLVLFLAGVGLLYIGLRGTAYVALAALLGIVGRGRESQGKEAVQSWKRETSRRLVACYTSRKYLCSGAPKVP